jgi:hypothetical protein
MISLGQAVPEICGFVCQISVFRSTLNSTLKKCHIGSVSFYSWVEHGLELMISYSFLPPNHATNLKQTLPSFPFPYHYTILLEKFISDLKRLKIEKISLKDPKTKLRAPFKDWNKTSIKKSTWARRPSYASTRLDKSFYKALNVKLEGLKCLVDFLKHRILVSVSEGHSEVSFWVFLRSFFNFIYLNC